MSVRIWPIVVLTLVGALWGMTLPLAKIAVSGDYRAFGLIFWQLAIGAVLLGTATIFRGKRLPLGPAQLRVCVVIALIGTVFPNTASYEAMRHLPAGLISVLLSLVPILAFPVALVLANDRFDWRRLAGLLIGLSGVAIIVVPQASLPDRAMVAFIPVALIASFFYAFEGNVVARWGTAGLDPMQLLCGASVTGALVTLPLALASGTFIDPRPPWAAPDLALILSSLFHVTAYTGYVWMIGRTGPVYAVQAGYLVTGFGVLWSMALLGERYSGSIWAAMAVMFAGIFLVRPRAPAALAVPDKAGQDRA